MATLFGAGPTSHRVDSASTRRVTRTFAWCTQSPAGWQCRCASLAITIRLAGVFESLSDRLTRRPAGAGKGRLTDADIDAHTAKFGLAAGN